MAYFQILDKKSDIHEQKITDSPIAIFIDNSGSTGAKINGQTRLKHELSVAHIFKDLNHLSVCTWDTSSKVIYSNMKGDIGCTSNGGTEPQCIMKNPQTKTIFEQSRVIIFMTDGEISTNDVTAFASLIGQTIQNKCIICVIVCNDNINPNISVFAPFLIANDVLFLHYVGKDATILHSKGQFNQKYHIKSAIPIRLIRDITLADNLPEIPDGYTVVGETDECVKVYNFDRLINCNEIKSDDLSLDNWKIILQHSKINNTISVIRNKIDMWRNLNISNSIESLKRNISTPLADKKRSLIEKIMDTEDVNEKTQLSQQLHDLIPDSRVEEILVSQQISQYLKEIRTYWDTIRDMMHHFEESSYHLSDLTYTSNRAKRAKNVDENDIIEASISQEGVPESYCSLHLGNGPTVLWLSAPANLCETTDDFVINFPLAKYACLQKCIKANPVCGDCASAYFAARKITMYNEPINGFIPLNVQDNKQYVYAQLCKILCGGKCLGHVNLLLLSMIDDCHYDWLDQCIKSYVINQLISTIITTDTFSEEGNKMVMKEALNKVNSDALFAQPFFAAIRLLMFCKMFTKTGIDTIMDSTRDRFRYTIIMGILSSLLKYGYDHNKQVIDQLLYKHICGIPVITDDNSIMLPTINDLKVLFSQVEIDETNEILERLSKQLNVNIAELIPSAVIGQILLVAKSVKIHERPLTVYRNLMKNNSSFKNSLIMTEKESIFSLKNDLIGKYKEIDHYFLPPYAIYNSHESGPSKLFYGDQCLISDYLGHTTTIDRTHQGQIPQIIENRLHHKLSEQYGSIHPSSKSGHVPIHRLVAQVCERDFKENLEPSIDIFIKCLQAVRDTSGQKGNIYSKRIIDGTILCVYDFMELRKTHKNHYKGDESISIKSKILYELEDFGATIQTNGDISIINLPDHIPTPVDLRIKYQRVDIDEIIHQIESNLTVKSDDKVAGKDQCVNMINDTPIAINIPASSQHLETWDMEQKEILQHVVLTDSIDLEKVKLIAGCDISFDKNDATNSVASMVICKYPFASTEYEVIGQFSIRCVTNIPYKAGYLAFREAPILLKLLDIIKTDFAHLVPEIIFFDGNGVWHPRGCGIATHISVLSGIPCLGVSKNVLQADGITTEKIRSLLETSQLKEGQSLKIVGDSGCELGYVYNPTGGISSCLYISAGNGMSNEMAVELVKSVSIHRVVEPIRLADLLSRKLLDTL